MIPNKYILFIIVLLTACSNNKFNQKFSSGNVNIKFLNQPNSLLTDKKIGEYLIYATNTYSDKTDIYDDVSNFVTYKNHDTLFMLFPITDGIIKVKINNDAYDIIIHYFTDIGNTYPDGDGGGTSYSADIEKMELCFKSYNFYIGGKVDGVITVETKPYTFLSSTRRDRYLIIFKAKVMSEDDFQKTCQLLFIRDV